MGCARQQARKDRGNAVMDMDGIGGTALIRIPVTVLLVLGIAALVKFLPRK